MTSKVKIPMFITHREHELLNERAVLMKMWSFLRPDIMGRELARRYEYLRDDDRISFIARSQGYGHPLELVIKP